VEQGKKEFKEYKEFEEFKEETRAELVCEALAVPPT
jgi:hypothetical protein